MFASRIWASICVPKPTPFDTAGSTDLAVSKGVDCETDKCENTYTSLSLSASSVKPRRLETCRTCVFHRTGSMALTFLRARGEPAKFESVKNQGDEYSMQPRGLMPPGRPEASVVSHADRLLLRAVLARVTFSRMSLAFAVQMKGFGF